MEGCALGVGDAGSRGGRQVPVGDVSDIVSNAGQGQNYTAMAVSQGALFSLTFA